jgi:peptide/nickel transport system ATP-binding protein
MLLLEFCEVTKVFRQKLLKKGKLEAVKGVSLEIRTGEIFGLMGESGSGKSTLGKIALGLLPPSSGEVLWEGKQWTSLSSKERLAVQGISQNPYGVFNPRHKMGYSLAEPLDYHRVLKDQEDKSLQIKEMLELVNMDEDSLSKYPGQFSGGQLQRLAIARVLLLNPNLIVADEPTTMLDLTIQAQIMHLFKRIHEQKGVAVLLISHDLPVVAALAQRIGIMYGGRLVEMGSTEEIINNALHPYTRLFLAAAREEAFPEPQSRDSDADRGCIYCSICDQAVEICRQKEPELISVGPEHDAACHMVNSVGNGDRS